MKLIETFRCLRIQINIPCKVQLLDIFKIFNDDSLVLRLTYESQHFCMPIFSKDHNLCILMRIKLFLDATLQR